jgi:hypothetical protein
MHTYSTLNEYAHTKPLSSLFFHTTSLYSKKDPHEGHLSPVRSRCDLNDKHLPLRLCIRLQTGPVRMQVLCSRPTQPGQRSHCLAGDAGLPIRRSGSDSPRAIFGFSVSRFLGTSEVASTTSFSLYGIYEHPDPLVDVDVSLNVPIHLCMRNIPYHSLPCVKLCPPH